MNKYATILSALLLFTCQRPTLSSPPIQTAAPVVVDSKNAPPQSTPPNLSAKAPTESDILPKDTPVEFCGKTWPLNTTEMNVYCSELNCRPDSLEPLACLTNLVTLRLSDCHQITSLSPLSRIKNLKELSLVSVTLDDYSILDSFPSLTNLSIVSPDFTTPNKFKPIMNLPHIRSLTINNSKLLSLSQIALFTNLEYLNIADINSDDNFVPLENLQKLKKISIDEHQLNKDIFFNLKNIQNLVSLVINHISFPHDNLTPIDSIKELEIHSWEHKNIMHYNDMQRGRDCSTKRKCKTFKSGNTLEILRFTPNVESLILYGHILDLKPIGYLKKIRKLTSYSNFSCDKAVFKPSYFSRLDTLIYKIKTDNFPCLNQLTSLRVLDLSNSDVKSLKQLSSVKKLEQLYLSNTPVEDISILRHFSHLKYLNIANTNVPQSQINLLKNANKNIIIDR